MKQIVILGAGGFAREVFWLTQEINKNRDTAITVHGFIAESAETHLNGLPILGDDNWAFSHLDRNVHFVIAIGNPALRQAVASKYLEHGFRAARLIHPSVHMAEDVEIGRGSIVCAGAVLTTQIQIGDFGIVNINATIGHDCNFGDFVTVHPGANISGSVQIGTGVEIGTGAVILPEIVVAEKAVVGAGAVVTRNLDEARIYTGIPAREIGLGNPEN